MGVGGSGGPTAIRVKLKASSCRLSGPSRNRDFFLCSEGPPAQPLANRSRLRACARRRLGVDGTDLLAILGLDTYHATLDRVEGGWATDLLPVIGNDANNIGKRGAGEGIR